MSVILHEADGTVKAGEEAISPEMRAYADEHGGYVVDTETGDIIHDARKG
ncbi:hypothetical protein HOT42_gp17 [Microbacterium phage Metamorphoo]|uniref:Uncharacterized protein n=1 Tax=Microbacterium phage Metamorphoo TaxID=2201437 RepID=A0A2Z4Q791_9CAUD|nr:hypothetical protein HOT42_gp17 [Microbacterium phage Metamorphoo]AWY05368.1 hypothetical protein SEA_METAMORPHOO_17 [Microbacterium phage Metamorphoo]